MTPALCAGVFFGIRAQYVCCSCAATDLLRWEAFLQLTSLSDPDLRGLEAEWLSLLRVSGVDPLFNSPEWLIAWWDEYQAAANAQARVCLIGNPADPDGMALAHAREIRYPLGFRSKRLQLMGTVWRAQGVGFSEKTDVIARSGFEAEVIDVLGQALGSHKSWDELLVSHTPVGGHASELFSQVSRQSGGYLRRMDEMEGWEVCLRGGWDAFVQQLGKGTSARVLGSRRRLSQAGEVRERILATDELEYGWRIFSRMHEARWGRPFSHHWESFYGRVAASQINRGVPTFSVLEFEGEPISVLVNFRAGRREYSIASGFVPVDVKRVSPGWLHFGLAIERACRDGIEYFDFLGGEGKNEQYKAAFGGQAYTLISLQLIRHPILARAYAAWDVLQRIRGN